MVDEVTAAHEAAHAVINYRSAGFAGGPISIVRREGTMGTSSDGVSDSFNAEHIEARILSCYAGGHAQREVAPEVADGGRWGDDDIAAALLVERAWEAREQELRDRSLVLVRQHWQEIVAVAEELARLRVLNDTEIEIIADRAAGDADADIEIYRQVAGDDLESWRRRKIDGEELW